MPCGYPGSTTLTGYRFHKPPAENPVWVFGKGFFNSRLPRYCTHPSTVQAGILAKLLFEKPGFFDNTVAKKAVWIPREHNPYRL
jgi:hypothetical protein